MVLLKCKFYSVSTYLHVEPHAKKKVSALDVSISRIQARYLNQLHTGKIDWPKHHVSQYVRLALVDKEDIIIRDKTLNEITRLTLQGEIDKILKRKRPIGGLEDIFHFQSQPCPRVILVVGGPGEY